MKAPFPYMVLAAALSMAASISFNWRNACKTRLPKFKTKKFDPMFSMEFLHTPLCLLRELSKGLFRRMHGYLCSHPTAMSKHQWGNGKENQAKGTRNHTAESLKESMDDRHNMLAPFLCSIVFTNVIRFLKKEGNNDFLLYFIKHIHTPNFPMKYHHVYQ